MPQGHWKGNNASYIFFASSACVFFIYRKMDGWAQNVGDGGEGGGGAGRGGGSVSRTILKIHICCSLEVHCVSQRLSGMSV